MPQLPEYIITTQKIPTHLQKPNILSKVFRPAQFPYRTLKDKTPKNKTTYKSDSLIKKNQ